MTYVSCMGLVYKFTKPRYKAYLRQFAKDGYADPEHFGKCVGTLHNVTDMTPAQAQERLDLLHADKK